MIERRKGDGKWEIEGEKKHRTGAAAGPDVVEGQAVCMGRRHPARRWAHVILDRILVQMRHTTILLLYYDILIDSICMIIGVCIVDCIGTKT